MTEESFWGDLENIKIGPTPLVYLKDQASKLSKLTGGIIRAKVVSIKAIANEFGFSLIIVAPLLNNYEAEILRMGYDIALYPLRISDIANRKPYECSSEEEFLSALKEILSSARVRQIIQSLLSSSADAKK